MESISSMKLCLSFILSFARDSIRNLCPPATLSLKVIKAMMNNFLLKFYSISLRELDFIN